MATMDSDGDIQNVKSYDGLTDEGWTMVKRPWHKLTWNIAPGELTIDLQDGCRGGHHGYHNKMFLAILNLMSPECFTPSFGLI